MRKILLTVVAAIFPVVAINKINSKRAPQAKKRT
jgi:hypothetical protein